LRDCGTDIEAIGGTINTKAFKKSNFYWSGTTVGVKKMKPSQCKGFGYLVRGIYSDQA
jgi:hypothetical protein